MRFFLHARAVLIKDLTLEWRQRTRLLSILLFGIVTLLLFSFAAGADAEVLSRTAAGYLVLALFLSSTLGLAESFRSEHEGRPLEGLLLAPVEPMAVYYGKAVAATCFLVLLAPVLTIASVVLYSVEITAVGFLKMLGLWLLGSAGLAAPGTLYAAMTSRMRSQDVLLPLLLFPLEVPVLISTVKAFDLALSGDPMAQLSSWTWFLVSFDVIYWSLCGLLFPRIVDEGSQ